MKNKAAFIIWADYDGHHIEEFPDAGDPGREVVEIRFLEILKLHQSKFNGTQYPRAIFGHELEVKVTEVATVVSLY
jgi:hypothetical protein